MQPFLWSAMISSRRSGWNPIFSPSSFHFEKWDSSLFISCNHSRARIYYVLSNMWYSSALPSHTPTVCKWWMTFCNVGAWHTFPLFCPEQGRCYHTSRQLCTLWSQIALTWLWNVCGKACKLSLLYASFSGQVQGTHPSFQSQNVNYYSSDGIVHGDRIV